MENQTLCESLDGGAEQGAMDRKGPQPILGNHRRDNALNFSPVGWLSFCCDGSMHSVKR